MPRALRLPLALVTLVGVVRPAAAANSVQGIATVAVGYDSNILAQPSDTPGGRIGDGEGTLSLGIIYTSALARVQQQLSYQFAGMLYFDHTGESNYANRLDWRGSFDTSRTTTLRLNVGILQARINSFLITGASGVTTPTLTTTDDEQTLTITAGASLLWEPRERTRVTFTSNFASLIGLGQEQPTTYTLTNLVVFEQLFRRDAVGFRIGADETIFGDIHGPVMRPDGSTDPDGVVTPGYQLLLLRALGTWRRDLNRFFNIHLAAGIVGGLRPDDTSVRPVVQPAAEAALRFFDQHLSVELQYRHDMVPNILVAEAFVVDSATLRLNAPLGVSTHLVAGASGGYQYVQNLLPNETLSGSAQVALADATLGYSPRAGITLFARYQFTKQFDVRTTSDFTINPFVRHVAMLGATFVYPTEAAVAGPPHIGTRVDGADSTHAPPVHTPVVAGEGAAN